MHITSPTTWQSSASLDKDLKFESKGLIEMLCTAFGSSSQTICRRRKKITAPAKWKLGVTQSWNFRVWKQVHYCQRKAVPDVKKGKASVDVVTISDITHACRVWPIDIRVNNRRYFNKRVDGTQKTSGIWLALTQLRCWAGCSFRIRVKYGPLRNNWVCVQRSALT